MSGSTASIIKELRKLPSDEKLEIIGDLWDSIPESEIPVSEETLEELARRADELERHPERGISWEQVRSELRKR